MTHLIDTPNYEESRSREIATPDIELACKVYLKRAFLLRERKISCMNHHELIELRLLSLISYRMNLLR